MNWSDLLGARLIQHMYLHQCRTARQLVEAFPHPATLNELDNRELSQWIPDPTCRQQWSDPHLRASLEEELEWYERHHIHIDFIHDPQYPARMKECPDAPILLYRCGNTPAHPPRTLGIVGTRNATPYGKAFVRELIRSAAQLNPSPYIISGLAYGIDIEAHRCALQEGLVTHAVLANGLDHIYPSNHRNTAIQLLQQGVLWSEFPKGTPSLPLHFLQRNRIIAGLCDAIVLCESALRGGGMSTARLAASYAREVFALPGRIHDPRSAGCNALIQNQTAQLLSSPEQLWKQLGWQELKKKKSTSKELSIFESSSELPHKILRLLDERTRLTPDQLLDLCPEADLQELSVALTAMELEGLIQQEAGCYSRY